METRQCNRGILAVSTLIIALRVRQASKKQVKRRCWIRKWIARRNDVKLPPDLDSFSFQNFLRMSMADFAYLVQLLSPTVAKEDTHFRRAITVQDRLAVTLRFLATGDSFSSLQYLCRMGKSTISGIIPEICEALWNQLKPFYMQVSINLRDMILI